jgi:hypothetical protein
MYKVVGGGAIRGIRFGNRGKVEVLVVPKKRAKAKPKKKRKPTG